MFVEKKDGSTCFCVNFQKVNAVTQKDAQQLDLASGYWQVEVTPENHEKTAFMTHYGQFQFCVMPFGLTNAPATF